MALISGPDTDDEPSDGEASELSRKLGRVIRDGRKRLGVSSRSIAEALKCSRPQLSRMETGKQNFSLAAVERVAELFGMSGSELIAAAEGTQRVPLSRHILAQQKFGALSTRLERLRRELERVCDEPRALTILEKQEGQEP